MIAFISILLRRAPKRQAALLIGLAGACTVLGGILFAMAEHYSVGTGLYFAVTTATTVGYGDVTPHNALGRVIAVAIMLTTIPLLGAVFALWAGAVSSARIRRLLGMEHHVPSGPFRLVVGWHPTVPRVVEELQRLGLSAVVVADVDPEGLPGEIELFRGDPTNRAVLRRAHPERAEQALIVGTDDGDVLVIAVLLRELAPELAVAALTQSSAVAEALQDLGVSRTLSSDELLAHTLAKSMETPHAADLLLRLVDSERYELKEVEIRPDEIGKELSALRDQRDELVLGLISVGDHEAVSLGVGSDPEAAAGDRLLVLLEAPAAGAAGALRFKRTEVRERV